MKYIIALLLVTQVIQAKTIKEGDMEYSCQPKKTCQDELKAAKAEIKRLKEQVAQLKAHPRIITEQVEVETKVIKKHIVSLLAVKEVKKLEASVSGNVGKAEVETAYMPALTYQYQFDNGLVPLIGVSVKGSPILGLGLEF